MKEEFENNLNELRNNIQTFIMELGANLNSKEHERYYQSESIDKVVDSAIMLDENMKKLEKHQDLVNKIKKVDLLIKKEDELVINLLETLMVKRNELTKTIDKAEAITNLINNNKRPLNVNDIIEYGRRISKFTSAPPNYDPSITVIPAEPPYPIEVAMRAGLINQDIEKEAMKSDEIVSGTENSFENINPIISHFGAINNGNNEEEFFDLDLDSDLD